MWTELTDDQKRQCVGVKSLQGQGTIQVLTTEGRILTTGEIVSVEEYRAWKDHARYATHIDGDLVPVNHQFKYWHPG